MPSASSSIFISVPMSINKQTRQTTFLLNVHAEKHCAQYAPTIFFLSACACRLTAPQARKFLLGWLSWTPINSHRELRSPPKIAHVNRWIFDCTVQSHIAAVSSALRQLERNSRCGYRGVHTRFAAQLPPFSCGSTHRSVKGLKITITGTGSAHWTRRRIRC